MRIMSYNVNGIRARWDQLTAVLDTLQPDIVGLQETKVIDEDFPLQDLNALGYHAHFHGQKTHYGVAILSKTTPLSTAKGFPHDDEDAQRRLVCASFPLASGAKLHIVNGYFPQGESRDHPTKFPEKRKFYADLHRHLIQAHQAGDLLAVLGDFNVAPQDKDVGIGEDNVKRWLRTGKCSFLPEEREWIGRLFDWGLHDSYREKNLETADVFSWFDYRTKAFEREPKRGLRIDMVLATKPLMALCRDARIDYHFRGQPKPSDHCPVWADFAL